jgi:glycosyltransferase involved in cell wall biosynthesis
MKILIIGNGAIGNVEGKYSVNKHTAKFAEELLASNFDVGFLQSKEIIQKNVGLQDYPLDKNITIHTITQNTSKGKIRKILFYLSMSVLTIKTILQYDFIYIFYPGHIPVISSLASIIFRKKYALYVRGQYGLDTKLGIFIIKRAKFCLTVSDLLKEKLLYHNDNTAMIAPMIDFSKKDILIDRNYSNDGIVRCLFVGRIELRKGIYDLMNAIRVLNDQRDDLHFDIVGGGDNFNELTERFKEVENVCFKGQISETKELLDMYRQADLFIFPSHDEGFPRVLYEAMMARVPVITTMVGGIGGFMKDHHSCLAIESQSSESIVRAVKEMLDSTELRMKLVNQATQDVLILFDGTRKKHSELLINQVEV